MAFNKSYKSSITIFDVDDTLVITKSKIKVINPKTGYSSELTPQEFNTFKKRRGDEMDFSDFRNVDILKAGKIIEWVFNILKRNHITLIFIRLLFLRFIFLLVCVIIIIYKIPAF